MWKEGEPMERLTTAEAETIRDAAKAKILEMGAKMSVAVVDERGDLITMVRVDGAPWRTPRICQAKAVASAAFGRSSKDMLEMAQTPVMRGLMAMENGRMIPGQGALPVFKGDELVGAVGGSGGTAQQDEDAARAGIQAVAGLTTVD